MSLDEKIRDLAMAQKRLNGLREAYQLKLKELESSTLYLNFEAESKLIETLKDKIRELALESYGKDGNKNPHNAVAIKIITGLGIDTVKAIEYAKRELPQALTLDTRVFTKIVKALPDEKVPDCVTITKSPRAEIARDLSAFLVKEGVKK